MVSSNKPVKIYCDNGGCTKEIQLLQNEGVVAVFMFKYENKNSKIGNETQPSQANWGDLKNYTWSQLVWPWADFAGSEKHDNILKIIGGKKNRVDALHLDSAYKSNCEIFITSDKDDIWNHREALFDLLKIHVLHTSEEEKLHTLIKELTSQ